jgi:CheY-like chemotaxis protein
MEAAKILTVEDDPIVQADLRLMLEDAGYVVLPGARDGVEAIEHARNQRPDLIVMDLGLPRLDGISATERILEERDVPVVALTGRGNRDDLQRAASAGAIGHIVKPFSQSQLIDTLSDVLADRYARADQEAEHRHLMVMIDSMLRAGRSEREVVAAVESVTGRRVEAGETPNAIARVAEFVRRALGIV